MYSGGRGVVPSFCRARKYYERAIKLGDRAAVDNMQVLTCDTQTVMNGRGHHPATFRTPPTSDAFATPLPFSSLS